MRPKWPVWFPVFAASRRERRIWQRLVGLPNFPSVSSIRTVQVNSPLDQQRSYLFQMYTHWQTLGHETNATRSPASSIPAVATDW